jgi:hypothetical protein
MSRFRFPVALALAGLALLLAACNQGAGAPTVPVATRQAPTATAADIPPAVAIETPAPPVAGAWPDGQAQTSAEGAVTIIVTPLNLNGAADTLEFEVAMDTHSVELDMDLAALSSLSADNGLVADPSGWDAPSGGHHVSGILSFPRTVQGKALLEGTATVTLTIRGVDVAERIFEWSISG